MALPYFYIEEQINGSDTLVILAEDTSKHIVQVLRMKAGETLQLTDGRGNLYTAEITQIHKKFTGVKILSANYHPTPQRNVTVAISLIKNASRFEWFLEKATEIGVNEIIPLICERTEKHHFRLDRMKGILVSAMLQSQQSWLPKIGDPIRFTDHANNNGVSYTQKLIAHCEGTTKYSIKDFSNDTGTSISIGPEGDFSPKEIAQALENNFKPVTLGDTRLRTETAGIVAAVLLKNHL